MLVASGLRSTCHVMCLQKKWSKKLKSFIYVIKSQAVFIRINSSSLSFTLNHILLKRKSNDYRSNSIAFILPENDSKIETGMYALKLLFVSFEIPIPFLLINRQIDGKIRQRLGVMAVT